MPLNRNRKEDEMTELTTLEEKLAEVLGLAQAIEMKLAGGKDPYGES